MYKYPPYSMRLCTALIISIFIQYLCSMKQILLAVIFFACIVLPATANNAAYEQRRTNYIATALANFDNDAITIQAYQSVPVDSSELNSLLAGIPTGEVADFAIVKLIRVLFFSSGQYDTLILPVLDSVPFWLTKNEVTRGYWSENHMIMWMSSDWLLHEKYGRPVDTNLNERLRHYLRLKNQYGFYEFFSSVYAPYALSGLLNLADFAQDLEIKQLATDAASRLLKDLLAVTTSSGVFFPAAGRNYFGKYTSAYNQNHNHLIFLLTGFGQQPSTASHAGGFLATSSLPVDSIIDSWHSTADTHYHIGHPIDSFNSIHSTMSAIDKTIFQWSSGAYFHPSVVLQTAQLLSDSNLWGHVDFSLLAPFSGLPVQDFPQLAGSLSYMSHSSVICEQDVAVFKHNEISLSSIQNFWPGYVGYQEQPCVAAVGTAAVLLASGDSPHNWNSSSGNNLNDNLPYVEQKKNLALLMYRPEPRLAILGYNITDVEIHWQQNLFDEVVTDSNWLQGRQGKNFVAVRRSCLGDDTVTFCSKTRGQTWALVVGDSSMYGSFQNFKNIVHQSQVEENWFIDTLNNQSVYHAKIILDTLSIEHHWSVDTILTTSINDMSVNNATIYPNPVNGTLQIKVDSEHEVSFLQIYDLSGRTLLQKQWTGSSVSVDVSQISTGMYLFSLGNKKQKLKSGKLIIE